MFRLFLSFIFCFALASCGGGGGGNSLATPSPTGSSGQPSTPNYGLWNGSSSTGADFSVLLTEDALYVVSFSVFQARKPEEIMVTEYQLSGDDITAEDATYFSLSNGGGTVDVEISGVAGNSATGSVSSSSGTITFNADFDGTSVIGDQSLSKVIGYSRGLSIDSFGFEQSVLEVNSNGEMRGYNSAGCLITGTLVETPGRRYYEFSASVANDSCETVRGTQFGGAALYDEQINLLYLLGKSTDNTSGLAYWGDMTRASTQQTISEVARGGGASLAEGLWLGYTEDDRIGVSIISEGGDGYVFYTDPSRSQWAGVGVARLENSTAGVLSTFARDFSWEFADIFDLTISGSIADGRFTGTLDYGANGSNSFDLSYDNTYELTAEISNVVGSYTGIGGSGFGQESVQFTVNEQGLYAGISEYGCEAGGYLVPRSRGNVFDVSISFGPEPCAYANQTLMGNALYHPDLNILFMAAPDSLFAGGVAVVASRVQ